MSKSVIGRFVSSLLALLIASSMSHTYAQSQSGVVSDEDAAEILESLVQLQIKKLGSEFGNVTAFSSENIGPVSASRLKKHGFSLISAADIATRIRDHVIDYLIVRSIYRREAVVVVTLSAVTEGRPCFAPAFSRQRSFTYEFEESAFGWVGRLVKRPVPFPFSRSFATSPYFVLQ